MKKRIIFVLCMGLAVFLAACGGTRPTQGGWSVSAESSLASEASEPSVPEAVSSQDALKNDPPQGSSSADETSQPQPSKTTAPDGEPSQTQPAPSETSDQPENEEIASEETDMKLNVQVGGKTFTATLEENAAVDAFVKIMNETPVVLEMRENYGFEKVGNLGPELPASDSRTITRAGDIVLYNGNRIVIFYGSNAWSYTRLGRIDDLTGWKEALGGGDVTVTFSIGD